MAILRTSLSAAEFSRRLDATVKEVERLQGQVSLPRATQVEMNGDHVSVKLFLRSDRGDEPK